MKPAMEWPNLKVNVIFDLPSITSPVHNVGLPQIFPKSCWFNPSCTSSKVIAELLLPGTSNGKNETACEKTSDNTYLTDSNPYHNFREELKGHSLKLGSFACLRYGL